MTIRLRWLVFILASLSATDNSLRATDRLICCGGKEVFVVEIEHDQGQNPKSIWSWKAEDSPEIPESARSSFATTDECKPFGDNLLITSSSDGVALVRRSDKRCLFFTNARNAHSACLLPRDRVAVASSFGGDELLVYALDSPGTGPAKPIAGIPLRGAHGVIWDTKQNRLWALGSDELLLVKVGDRPTDPALDVEQRVELPTLGGHDLSQSNDKAIFFVTTNEHVYRFDVSDGSFTLDPTLADQPKVKSISQHPRTGEIVYHQGTRKTWWSDTIRFIGRKQDIQLPGRRLYKVRWDR